MNPFNQRWPCVAEKVWVQETRRTARATRRKIGSSSRKRQQGRAGLVRRVRCGSVVGMSLHAPMT